MSDKTKTIELTRRLKNAFPDKVIFVMHSFFTHRYNYSIDTSYDVNINGMPWKTGLRGLVELEEYVDFIINEKSKEEE